MEEPTFERIRKFGMIEQASMNKENGKKVKNVQSLRKTYKSKNKQGKKDTKSIKKRQAATKKRGRKNISAM